MHYQNIEYIVEHGTEADMVELKNIMCEVICEIKGLDKAAYQQYEYKLQCLAHHDHLDETLAKDWVSRMQNKDGSCGEHWTWEEVQQVKRDRGLNLDMADFYAALNMVYSDYYNPKFDTSIYVELAKDWLNDKDIDGAKLLKYYYFVVCGE